MFAQFYGMACSIFLLCYPIHKTFERGKWVSCMNGNILHYCSGEIVMNADGAIQFVDYF